MKSLSSYIIYESIFDANEESIKQIDDAIYTDISSKLNNGKFSQFELHSENGKYYIQINNPAPQGLHTIGTRIYNEDDWFIPALKKKFPILIPISKTSWDSIISDGNKDDKDGYFACSWNIDEIREVKSSKPHHRAVELDIEIKVNYHSYEYDKRTKYHKYIRTIELDWEEPSFVEKIKHSLRKIKIELPDTHYGMYRTKTYVVYDVIAGALKKMFKKN